MNDHSRFDLPETLPIMDIFEESASTKTLVFEVPEEIVENTKPGEYFMLWLPGVDEKPISVSRVADNVIHFTICSVGNTTEAMVNCKKGDLVGLRGPYGNGFTLQNDKNKMIIAGGMGIAPLRYLIDALLKIESSNRLVLIHGAKTVDELYYREEFDSLPVETFYCTDDGSHGYHGFPTVLMEQLMRKEGFNAGKWFVYSCGPEIMLKSVLSLCKNYNLETCTEISLADRHVRCGFGICGSCYIDDCGLSLCRDGPVFNGEILLKTSDFGKYGRLSNGSKNKL